MRAIVAIVLALCASPFAFGEVNFSGNWVYDAAASTLPHSGGLTMIHSGNSLTMIWTTQNGVSEFKCVLDASEHNIVVSARTIKYRSVLDGNVLHITWTVTSNGKTDLPLEDTYILSDGGRTLTRLVPVRGMRGPMVHKVVFRKGK